MLKNQNINQNLIMTIKCENKKSEECFDHLMRVSLSLGHTPYSFPALV